MLAWFLEHFVEDFGEILQNIKNTEEILELI